LLPAPGGCGSLLENPGADGVDEAELFGHRDEDAGGICRARVRPAQQGFGLGAAAGEVEDGLVVQRQLAGGEGEAQVLAQLQVLQARSAWPARSS
jgi:hypothetical protein